MSEIQIAKRKRLIKTAHELMDRIELNLQFIVKSVKNKKQKKAA